MKFHALGLACLLSLAPVGAFAQDSDLSRYSCDHFLLGACLRVPNGMSTTYSMPADYGLHVVTRGDRSVLTLYEGDAPQRPHADASSTLSLTTSGYRLFGFLTNDEGGVRYDVYVDTDRTGVMSVHLRGVVADEAQRKDLAAALGGFRMCTFKRSSRDQILTCPRRAVWGQQLAQWVQTTPDVKAR
ncbi:hypothetical protein [Stenotrophomonas sp.]|uniref:hypothetical protein n=1 Tax=Stenotrophomonas sp. TaxID=69392 RepID=UPI0028964EE5|nr:hypothetical protein [Stenotrophomonas sp.]